MPNAPYRIYAVRYAHRKCTTSEAFYGDYHAAPMTISVQIGRASCRERV